ncbi:hypothetical protein EMCG_09244 [[Emmonsia] crescens]|uniref:Uncharacterized protein n=1 Tax=[Emmonsia] crescens TaxID=73230 RepID=A0A0G2I2L8_9EURO|nr:hypothetical protein EMCG_09244 [Emmonsia crescens UAMH 3008]
MGQAVLDTENRGLSEIVKGLKHAPDGILHIGDDGVMRSFDEVGNVIDYARLNSTHLMTIAGWYSNGTQDHLQNVWANVDSFLVDEAQIWSPPEHLLPAQLSTELPAARVSVPEVNPLTSRQVIVHCPFISCTGHTRCRQYGCTECVIVDKVYSSTCVLF